MESERRPLPSIVQGPLLFCILAFLLGGCGGEAGRDERPAQRTVPVSAVRVEAETVRQTVTGVGTLAALKTVEIKPEVSGFVREIGFEGGQAVEAGAVLYRLSSDKLQQELAAARAEFAAARSRLELARRTHARRQELVEKQLVSREQFEEVKSDLSQARAETERLKARIGFIEEQIADTVLRASFAGEIGESLVDEGDYVDEGDPLATLYLLTVLEMEFRLPERYSGQVRVGQPVAIGTAAFPERTFQGEVSFVGPAVDPGTRDFLVKARVDNGERLLKPGTFGRALVVLAAREGRPVIPEEALVPTREGYLVFVVENGVARQREVAIGLREPGRVEIKEGVRPGEVVVRTGHLQLTEGDRVRMINEELRMKDEE